MSQIKVTGATVYSTMMFNGRILSPRYYGESELMPIDFRKMLEYEARQKALPPDKRDKPPVLKVDYVNVDEIRNAAQNKKNEADSVAKPYSEMSFNELKKAAKERGLTFANNTKQPELIVMLEADDAKINSELAWQDTFKSLDEFMPLTDEEKIAYVDEIFGLPDGLDAEGKEAEAEKYSADLMSAVRAYSSQSVSETVAAKLKEVLEYYES